MKNILGHDNDSEIATIIARLRENRFNVLSFDENTIQFEIVLTFRTTVPVPNTRTQKIKFIITKRYNGRTCDYYIKQINGANERLIPFSDGYIIYSLLEDRILD